MAVPHEQVRIGQHSASEVLWGIVPESPIHLVVNGETRTVLMATPDHLDDLARGVLHTELGLQASTQPISIAVDSAMGEYRVEVTLADDDAARLRARGQSLMANSACGLCGVEALADLASRTPSSARVSPHQVSDEAILAAFESLTAQQPLHAATHSAHAAAWCTASGDIVLVREDVGRHNALDKLIGALLNHGMPADGFLIMSSRCSYELIHKAAHTPARLLATWSAPTTMALEWSRHIKLPVMSVARDATRQTQVVHFASAISSNIGHHESTGHHVG
ncbi:MAG: formate dehydrogenase accessory sulfurtransferase FdhD [Gemmatimonadaceae bacterium]|nr:formate dehydrogenase accessory sulfurtransferase FdhD [Gemmatimonadaceae bacterium]